MNHSAQPPRITIDAVLRSALRAFAAFPGPGLAYFGVVTVWNCYDSADSQLDLADLASFPAGPWVFGAALSLAGSLLMGWLMCGLARVAIAGVRGEEATWNNTVVSLSEYFHAASALGTWLLATLLGLMLFIVPGIFAFLMWSQAFCSAIDRKESWTAALGRSRLISKGHYAEIFGVGVATGMLLLPGWILSASTLWNSATDIEEILGGAMPAASKSAAAAFDPAAAATMILSAALGAAAYTAMTYIGAALYVVLQDLYVAAQASKKVD